mgnify:CR=1 FL=1
MVWQLWYRPTRVFHAVSAATGKALWTFKTLAEIKSSPVVVGDRVLVGSYDVLRDDGVHYAHALIEAGVPTTLVEYRGLSHGFINMAAFLTAGRLALDQVGAALRHAIG